MRTRFGIALLITAALVAIPAVGNCWQSGRLKNQKPTPRASNASDSGSDAASPALANQVQPDTTKPERAIDPRYTKISWERSIRSALKTASTDNKVVVVDVYADWCGWCKRMDKVVYSDPKVAALMSEVVFVKVNSEDRGEGQQFARQIGIQGLPTTVILDHKGSVINKVTGYIGSPDRFINLVERSTAKQ